MISKKMRFMHKFFATLVSFFVISSFAAVWLLFYNNFAFRTHWTEGAVISIIIYSIIYIAIAQLYRGFKIGTYPLGEVIFSQILALGIANALLFAQCCLISNKYVSIVPGLITSLFQILCVVIWAAVVKRYYIHFTKPSDTLLICNHEHEGHSFKKMLGKKFSHFFKISRIETASTPLGTIQQKIDQSEAVILYELDAVLREQLMSHIIKHKKLLYVTPTVSDILMHGFENRHFVDTPLMKYEYAYEKPISYLGKRAIDLLFSILGLAVFSPFMFIFALFIKLEDGGPVLYKQKRCTKDGKVFEILKFRSMVVNAEENGTVIPCVANDSRITRVGKVIRKFRIDETPQIFNVLKNDMSIVGPRPERVEHMKEYCKKHPEFTYRLRVKGGLTGYAQIYGRYNTDAYDKLRLDMMYIENMSMLLDLKLIILTIKTIFISESTEAFTKEQSHYITRSEKASKFNKNVGEKAGENQFERKIV